MSSGFYGNWQQQQAGAAGTDDDHQGFVSAPWGVSGNVDVDPNNAGGYGSSGGAAPVDMAMDIDGSPMSGGQQHYPYDPNSGRGGGAGATLEQQPHYIAQEQYNYGVGAAGMGVATDYHNPHHPSQSPYDSSGYGGAGSGYGGYAGSIFTPHLPPSMHGSRGGAGAGPGATFMEDEPPLLDELGINFDHIRRKTLAVLNPWNTTDAEIVEDTDLAGPLCFCLLFGASLLLVGKVHFGYIYGIILVGCVSMYCLLNLMSLSGVSLICIMSVLGYCMLPMVFLSFGSVLLSLQSVLGTAVAVATILWCSVSASKLFVSALQMDHQQLLLAYPCALLYGVFALLTMF